MVTVRTFSFKENSRGRAGNRTRYLMINSQKLRLLDHEAGPVINNESKYLFLMLLVSSILAVDNDINSFRETCQWLKFRMNCLRAKSRVSPVVGLLSLASGPA